MCNGNCGSVSRGTAGCTCGGVILPAPTTIQPFYMNQPMSPEDSTKYIFQGQYSYGITFPADWNTPLIGASAILKTPTVTSNIPIGAWLWNVQFGYFQIVAFDFENQLLTITNSASTQDQVVVPGSAVPSCTTFLLTPTPSDISNQAGVFVKLDFTAPAINVPLDITLTGTEGLQAGGKVQIGTGVYSLVAIKANDVVTIENTGDGIIPGSPVIAQTVNGLYQYPVTYISVNPCSQSLNTSGVILGCVGSSASGINGAANGELLTLIDHTTGNAGYSNDIPTAVAANTAAIANNTANLVPCTLANNMITTFILESQDINATGAGSPATLAGGDGEGRSIGPTATVFVSNPSTCRNMQVTMTFSYNYNLFLNGFVDAYCGGDITYFGTNYYAVGTIASPPTPPVPSNILVQVIRGEIVHVEDGSPVGQLFTRTITFVLAPGDQIAYTSRCEVSFGNYGGDSNSTRLLVDGLTAYISYLAVAL